MASEIANLFVTVSARGVTQVNRDLAKVQGRLKETDKHATRAQRTFGGFSGAAKTAAKGLVAFGGAFAAYRGVKSAITTTEELAKSTAKLSELTGMDSRTASAWVEVAKQRGVAGKALNMGFITLSRNIENAANGSKKSADALHKLGVSQAEIKRGDTSEVIHKISDAFARMPAGAEKAAFTQQLFGRQAQTLLPLLNQGSAALDKQLGVVSKYGATMDRAGVRKALEAVQAQRKFKIALDGLKITIGSALLPEMTKLSTAGADAIRVLNSPISTDEKLKRLGKIAGPIAHDLEHGFEEAIPRIANTVGQNAPKVAMSFVHGFEHADVWGKLAIGGLLASKIGFGNIAMLGQRAGVGFGTSFATAAGPEMATAGRAGTGGLLAAARGSSVGPALALAFLGPAFGAAMRKQLHIQTTSFQTKIINDLGSNPAGGVAHAWYDTLRKLHLPIPKIDPFHQLQAGVHTIIVALGGDMHKMVKDADDAASRVGTTMAGRMVTGFAGAKRVTRSNIAEMVASIETLPPAGRSAAARTAVNMAQELERRGQLPKGTARRLAREMLNTFDDLSAGARHSLSKLAGDGSSSLGTLSGAARRTRGFFDQLGPAASGARGPMHSLGESARTLGGLFGGVSRNIDTVIRALGHLPRHVNVNTSYTHTGIPPRKKAAGGKTSGAELALIGEGGGPEYVIPTEPRYRSRAIGLLHAAASDLNVVGFKAGGKAGKGKTKKPRPIPSDLPSDPGLTGHERYVLASLQRDIALADLTPWATDDIKYADKLVAFWDKKLKAELKSKKKPSAPTVQHAAEMLKAARQARADLIPAAPEPTTPTDTGTTDSGTTDTSGDTSPPEPPPGPDTAADLQAQLDQSKLREATSARAAQIAGQTLSVFGGSGDIGESNYANAYNAARGGPTIIINQNNLHPGDQTVLKRAAEAVTAGLGLQGSRSSSTEVSGA